MQTGVSGTTLTQKLCQFPITYFIPVLNPYHVRFFNAVRLENWEVKEYKVRLKISNWIYGCKIWLFLDAFTEVRKTTIGFAKSVHLSVSLSVRMDLGSHWTYFHDIWYLRIFRKCVEKIQILLKSDNNNGYSTWRPTYTCLIISRSILLRIKSVSDNIIEDIKTHIACSGTFFFKSCRLWDNVEKYGRARQVTCDSVKHVHYKLDT